MRFFMYVMVLALALSGCKKQVEATQEDLLIDLIVDGQWAVTKYTRDSVNITSVFSPYRFQFKKDFTLDAVINGTVAVTGTWNGDISTRTITSDFPTSNPILILLNGTWYVADSGLNYVDATQTVNGEARFLRLVKI